MSAVVDEIELPECDCGCGAPFSGDPNNDIRRDGSWTHPNCDAEAWAERLADERAGR